MTRKERETCAHAHAFPERTRRIWWDCVQDNSTNSTTREWAFAEADPPKNPPIYWSWKGRREATDLNKHGKSQYIVYFPLLDLDHIWWVYLLFGLLLLLFMVWSGQIKLYQQNLNYKILQQHNTLPHHTLLWKWHDFNNLCLNIIL